MLCRRKRHGFLSLVLLPLLHFLQCARGSGFFELQILEIANYRGELSSGACCGGVSRPDSLPCPIPCNTFFRVCLKEYQSNVTSTGSCSFGNTSSPVLGGNSFTLTDPDRANGKLVLPFTFRWTRSFTLILQALDLNNYTTPVKNSLIEEASYSGIINPSADWHTLNHLGIVARITYRVRVQCDLNYFNVTCTKFCRPRNDKFGHYNCDSFGEKACIEGWNGANCEIAVCKNGCHPVHGRCDNPGECECRPGWKGEFCDQCKPYPGCKHGYCNGSSWQCICDTNWGGILCDQDLNYCGTHEPCQNGGTCKNTAPDQYRCSCPEGFSGLNCEVVDNPCATEPCANDGTCKETAGQFHCACTSGWTGPTCSIIIDSCTVQANTSLVLIPSGVCGEHGRCFSQSGGGFRCSCDPGYTGKYCHENINDCKNDPCQNGGTCVDKVNSFQCICREGWEGEDCTVNKNECEPNPCRNNGTCIDGDADFSCECYGGWKGKTCSLRHSHCDRGTCRNGGTCQDLGHSYLCRCPTDWEGTTCHIAKTQACKSNPCQNGATCINTGEFYSCVCKEGFDGQHCEHDINDCNPPPCYNGGKCVDGVNWFLCECAPGFTGPDCRMNVNECATNPCGQGATCIDGIASYTCICPPSRKGPRCQEVVDSFSILRGVCLWQGQYFSNNTNWPHDCNTCSCVNGEVRCTRVWCGLGNCLGLAGSNCGDNQVCVPSPRESCLTGGCIPWGECRALLSGKLVGPPSLPTPPTCWPNQAILSDTCARLTLLLDRTKLGIGISSESLCGELRSLVSAHQANNGAYDTLVLLCDLKTGGNDTLEVTVSESSGNSQAVKEGVRVLGELISLKQTNSLSALTSVMEVKVETALLSPQKQGNGYWIGIFCLVLVMASMCVMAAMLYWHRTHRGTGLNSSGIEQCHRHHEDEKSNNLQNEENLRRYANPLKEESASQAGSLGGSLGDLAPRVSVVRPLSSASSAEMLEMICEAEGKTAAGEMFTTSSSQVLLLKTQNADVKKNTISETGNSNKDFACKRINLQSKVVPPVQRTLPTHSERSIDVLTVLV